MLFLASSHSLSAEPVATVLDHLILPQDRIDGLKLTELSGLAYDADDGVLRAVSDQGALFALGLSVESDRLRLDPLSGVTLVDAASAEMRDRGFSPEGMDLINADNGIAGDTEIALVSENPPGIARFSPAGVWLADQDLPQAVADPAAFSSPKNGLEALALHPVLGTLTLPEEPLAAAARMTHTIYAADGATLSFTTDAIGHTSVKALEVLPDGRILILERNRSADNLVLTPYLRLLDPTLCPTVGDCPTRTAIIDMKSLTDADFEGLAALGNGLFILASDDKINGERRSVVALIRLSIDE